jgi:hypothetical protein
MRLGTVGKRNGAGMVAALQVSSGPDKDLAKS